METATTTTTTTTAMDEREAAGEPKACATCRLAHVSCDR
jgi:hypothetical protein